MSDHNEEYSHHIVTPAVYARVFGILMMLLFLTVGAASINLGSGWNAAVAVGIAASKAIFILLFFMHLKYGSNLTRFVAACGFIWFGILVVFIMQDFLSRDLMGAIYETFAGSSGGPPPAAH